ncbi:MAG TPA: DMT family transporter [Turneriella sp.]|nr:DMT family transporter [Turneriella sp.]HNA79442.1 DMT family transporter [Turneriella sp.]HNE18815.1 DMT family transporter [Turneriella sp.]HNL09487.1 DMT family transporter [Turneriella sp.]HNN00402.1 DMT family transporter [Turneriella sp.]
MRLRNELLLVFAMVIWSGSWTSGKLIAGSADPNTTLFWRFIVSALALAPMVRFAGESFRISARQATWAALGGLIITVYTFLFFIGLKTGYAGAAGVLVTSMNPIFTYFLTRIFQGQNLNRRDGIGLMLGVSAGVILLELWSVSGEKLLLSGNLLFLVCAMIYALVTMTTNTATRSMSILVYSFYVNLLGALFVLPLALVHWQQTPVFSDTTYWFNIFYLGVISNAFATTVYFYAVKKLGSARASSYIFIVPATALLIAALYLDEPVRATTLVGGLLALVGVTLLRR